MRSPDRGVDSWRSQPGRPRACPFTVNFIRIRTLTIAPVYLLTLVPEPINRRYVYSLYPDIGESFIVILKLPAALKRPVVDKTIDKLINKPGIRYLAERVINSCLLIKSYARRGYSILDEHFTRYLSALTKHKRMFWCQRLLDSMLNVLVNRHSLRGSASRWVSENRLREKNTSRFQQYCLNHFNANKAC